MISSKFSYRVNKIRKLALSLPKGLKFGFTMIELLIVIAVLGVLAVAVLSAINPIEQINRGRDTGTRSDAEQLLSASDRFYTSMGYYAWATDATSTNTSVDPLIEIISATQTTIGADGEEVLTRLSAGGTAELKASFVTRIVAANSNHLWIYFTGTDGDSTYVCFVPRSASFRTEGYNRCRATLPADFSANACPNDATCVTAATALQATGCYVCLP